MARRRAEVPWIPVGFIILAIAAATRGTWLDRHEQSLKAKWEILDDFVHSHYDNGSWRLTPPTSPATVFQRTDHERGAPNSGSTTLTTTVVASKHGINVTITYEEPGTIRLALPYQPYVLFFPSTVSDSHTLDVFLQHRGGRAPAELHSCQECLQVDGAVPLAAGSPARKSTFLPQVNCTAAVVEACQIRLQTLNNLLYVSAPHQPNVKRPLHPNPTSSRLALIPPNHYVTGEIALVQWRPPGDPRFRHNCSSTWQKYVAPLVEQMPDSIMATALQVDRYTQQVVVPNRGRQPFFIFDKAMVFVEAELRAFQHFFDVALKKIIQALPILLADPDIVIVMVTTSHTNIEVFLNGLGLASSRLKFLDRATLTGARVRVRLLFLSCLTPHGVHSESLLGIHHKLGVPRGMPCEDRTNIIFFDRDNKTAAHGRLIKNGQAVRKVIEDVAREESQRLGLNFTVMVTTASPQLDHIVGVLRHARLVVGPHGGALYNAMLAPASVPLVEMNTKAFTHYSNASPAIFYWMSSALGRLYYYLRAESAGTKTTADLIVSVDDLKDLLRRALREDECGRKLNG